MRKAWRFWLLLLVVVLMFSSLPALIGAAGGVQKQISWTAATTYTDGSPIEPDKGVYYNIFMDNAALATKVAGTKRVFTVTDHEVVHVFQLQTELSTGAKSARSAPYLWTSPPGVPDSPGGCSIGDPDP